MLADVSIQIFDPGGMLTVVVCSAVRRRQIRSFRSMAFMFLASSVILFAT
ncbi:hypothetical protein A2U01_0095617, partial [Trifolium medium]|nr:hypothetical protein [Trifolium medium]